MIPFVIFDPQSNLPPPDTTARYVEGLGGGGQGGGLPYSLYNNIKEKDTKGYTSNKCLISHKYDKRLSFLNA